MVATGTDGQTQYKVMEEGGEQQLGPTETTLFGSTVLECEQRRNKQFGVIGGEEQ